MTTTTRDDNYFYRLHYKSSTASFWETFHTRSELYAFLNRYNDKRLSGVELTIIQDYGWDEQERKELARLKAKYEPESK